MSNDFTPYQNVNDPELKTLLASFRREVGGDAFDRSEPGQTMRPGTAALPGAADIPTYIQPAGLEATLVAKKPADAASSAGVLTIQQSSAGTFPVQNQNTFAHARESLARASEFTIHDLVGKGGMGEIFRAGQNALRREVAIKKMIPEHLGKEGAQKLERLFVSEALITGYLDHPNIVPVYSLGMDDAGKWFFTMKMVHGVEWRHLLHPSRCRDESARSRAMQRRLDIDDPASRAAHLDDNLRILLTICNAVAFAHSKKVIHRDLKPENVMVGAFGEVLVMDWGLAVDVSETPPPPGSLERRIPTRRECGVGGTPTYMAPEQLKCNELGEYFGEELNCWTDVFLLGAMLCELLTGSAPYPGQSIVDTLVKVSECVPPVMPDSVPAELAAICLKALSKNPRDRFADALSFQNALSDFLKHRESAAVAARAEREAKVEKIPDLARAVVLYDQALQLWPGNAPAKEGIEKARVKLAYLERCARHTRLGLAAALAALFIGLSIGFFWIRGERQIAMKAMNEEHAAKENAMSAAHQASLNMANGLVAQGNALLTSDRYFQAQEKFRSAWDKFEELHEPADAAEWGMWGYYHEVCTPLLTLSSTEARDGVGVIAILPDGKHAVSSTPENNLRIWDLLLGRPVAELKGHSTTLHATAISADGRRLISGDASGNVRVWDLEKNQQIKSMDTNIKALKWVAFSADGKRLLAGGAKFLIAWDAESGAEARIFRRDANIMSESCASGVGRTLSGGTNNLLALWNVVDGKKLSDFNGGDDPGKIVMSTAISTDGMLGVSGGTDKVVRIWDLKSAPVARELKGHKAAVMSVALSADGKRVLSGSTDLSLRLWDVSNGEMISEFDGHKYAVESVAISADGNTILSRATDRMLMSWDARSHMRVMEFKSHKKPVDCVAISPDGRLMFSAGRDFTMKLWDLETGRELRSVPGYALSAAFLPDGKCIATGNAVQGLIQIWDVATGDKLREFAVPFKYLAFSNDGKVVLTGGDDKALRLLSLEDGKVLKDFKDVPSAVRAVAVSHDSRRVLSCCDNDTMQTWDAESGKLLQTFRGRTGALNKAAFAPDGKKIVTGGNYGVVRMWDATGGNDPVEMRGHPDRVTSLAYSEDGNFIVSTSKDKTMKLWDVDEGFEIQEFTDHTDAVNCVAITRNGKRIVTGGDDALVKFWDGTYPARYRQLQRLLPEAQKKLAENPNDATSLNTLGEWYAFRGLNEMALEVMERAAKSGAVVSPLTLARCHVSLGHHAEALKAYERELSALPSGDERASRELHLRLCIAELKNALKK